MFGHNQYLLLLAYNLLVWSVHLYGQFYLDKTLYAGRTVATSYNYKSLTDMKNVTVGGGIQGHFNVNSDLPFAVRMTIDETAEYPRTL